MLQLATTPQQVKEALELVGGYGSWEAKVAYLEAVTGSQIAHRSGGDAEDDFWSLAEALVNGRLKVGVFHAI